MATTAAYDEIADWYETRFLAAQAEGDPLGARGRCTRCSAPEPGRAGAGPLRGGRRADSG